MINVEEEFAALHKQTIQLHEQAKEQGDKIRRLEEILWTAFPSLRDPKAIDVAPDARVPVGYVRR